MISKLLILSYAATLLIGLIHIQDHAVILFTGLYGLHLATSWFTA